VPAQTREGTLRRRARRAGIGDLAQKDPLRARERHAYADTWRSDCFCCTMARCNVRLVRPKYRLQQGKPSVSGMPAIDVGQIYTLASVASITIRPPTTNAAKAARSAFSTRSAQIDVSISYRRTSPPQGGTIAAKRWPISKASSSRNESSESDSRAGRPSRVFPIAAFARSLRANCSSSARFREAIREVSANRTHPAITLVGFRVDARPDLSGRRVWRKMVGQAVGVGGACCR